VREFTLAALIVANRHELQIDHELPTAAMHARPWCILPAKLMATA
jgi:hypothetical protein